MISKTWITWIAGAVALATLGLVQSSADLFIVSALAGGVGLAVRASAIRKYRLESTPDPGDDQINQLEEHLRLTEDELAATARELAALKEKHEFDKQLRRPIQ